ncbi:MAG: YdeI/OmpD-associated family protein [Saprospiraceae bacterium]|nr:YdeI/OmpD-associated family protein [Saprospiraceae bacterium]MCF8248598.1 YdeI/OmpD-associated family protein [Saprospiraceae bacterium]MCF8281036.1 YdeI/OmpD-associated family protein [Bacteroidales bacterium]MCF8310331.1 YdeI/OmpD-associated family protein [Saprospiraceae bacterium]MCF8442088.1 YdeI/OmpD-associated family protein [Saprospiraceae bacterium]
MSKIIEFTGVMDAVEGLPNNGTVVFPFDLKETFGKKSVKVKITYDGIEYRGLLKSMGGDCVWCLVRKDIREQLGKKPGDSIHITVQEDTEERVVIVPPDFQQVMEENPLMKPIFENFSYTCRKEYVNWITGAKRPETRQNRLQKSVELILSGKKEPR